MRKVIYQRWIPTMNTSGEKVPGTGCFSDPRSGFFHAWGSEVHEDGNSVAAESVALIEDVTTGIVYKVDPHKMRFVQPPETRVHSNDAAKVEIINAELLCKQVLDVLIPVLESINKKLDSL